MLKTLAIVFALTALQFVVQAQSENDEVKRLQGLVKENQNRALAAEAAAAQYLSRAIQAEKSAERCRYLSIAILLTYHVNEQADKILAGLLAVQSYHFIVKYGGDTPNNNIHNALLSALSKYGSVTQNLSNKELAEKLCGLMTRNLTKEEWSLYIGDDLSYEATCG